MFLMCLFNVCLMFLMCLFYVCLTNSLVSKLLFGLTLPVIKFLKYSKMIKVFLCVNKI